MPESCTIDARRSTEHLSYEPCIDKTRTAKWEQFTDRNRITSHDEGTARIEFAHDATALIAQLALAHDFSHN